MNILIAYASSEGQTARICDRVADQIRAAGHSPTLFDTADHGAKVKTGDYDRVILAGSVHQKKHQQDLAVYIAGAADTLRTRPTLMLSVSLAAAQTGKEDEARSYTDQLEVRTGFTPTRTAFVAGALHFSDYDYFKIQIIQHLILPGRKIDPDIKDHEFTDWDALQDTIASFLD